MKCLSRMNKALKILGIIAILILLSGVVQADDRTINGTTNILDQAQEGLNYGFWFERTVVRWQEFKPTQASLSQIDLYIVKKGNPGNLRVSVKNSARSLLWRTTVTEDNVKSGWIKIAVTPPIQLEVGKSYFIYVWSDAESPDPGNRYFWRGQTESDYDRGISSVESSWLGYDFAFRTWDGFAVTAVETIAQAQETDYELLWSYEVGGPVYDVSVSSDGSYVAAGSYDNNVYFFNHNGKLLWSYRTGALVYDVSVSSDGSYIAARSQDKKVYFFNKDGELLWSYEVGSTAWALLTWLSVSSDGSYIATGANHKVYLFNKDGELLWSHEMGLYVYGVSISSDGSYIAAGSHDKKAYFFNKDGELLWNYETGYSVRDVSISSNGSFIAAGSDKVYFFNKDGKLLWNYETGNYVESVSVSSDGSYIAAGSQDKKVYFFNRQGELLWSYETGNSVHDVSISSDGSYIATVSQDNKVYFFNKEGELLWSYETGGLVYRVPVSSDGSYIATGSYDNNVYFFARSEGLVKGVIEKAKSAVETGKAKGFYVAEAESLLSQAERAFNSGDYARARELANQAKARAEAIVKEVTEAKNVINEVESVISREKSRGFYMAEAEALLSQAKLAFSTDEYAKARGLAYRAKTLALDIDGDGVPNDSDFAPTIKNVYIYGVTISLTLVSACFAAIKIKRRKYARKVREYKAKIEEWEREGYKISGFRERWFK